MTEVGDFMEKVSFFVVKAEPTIRVKQRVSAIVVLKRVFMLFVVNMDSGFGIRKPWG